MDLPFVQSVKFEFVINLQTAKLLGIEVPPGVHAQNSVWRRRLYRGDNCRGCLEHTAKISLQRKGSLRGRENIE